eukprot:Protomagalhaensia_wolfi_Nauph_80__2992@NODE_3065_length_904_cov_15_846243_g2401_i0_p2_GENE_NODE_3065_length_904_cov_15_846243_g2401_i0NODE_3065_length_904_cov_15_846243_g2401_i0_p2_ORF_typecomplete_len123_score19_09_NODE_3065_length_904_cov_15_846243_g2401_i095463
MDTDNGQGTQSALIDEQWTRISRSYSYIQREETFIKEVCSFTPVTIFSSHQIAAPQSSINHLVIMRSLTLMAAISKVRVCRLECVFKVVKREGLSQLTTAKPVGDGSSQMMISSPATSKLHW